MKKVTKVQEKGLALIVWLPDTDEVGTGNKMLFF